MATCRSSQLYGSLTRSMSTNKAHNNEGNKTLTTSGHMIKPNDMKGKVSHVTHSSTSQFNLAESANKPQMASQSTRLQ